MSGLRKILYVMVLTGMMTSCARVITQRGDASYYADKFVGRRTASGEIFRQHRLTAASKTIPLGTKVKVTNLENGKSVRVRINDRGPYAQGRIIDLTKKAARKIGMLRQGVAPIRLKYKVRRRH
ncbi:MAG: septal ring lytic transglycosylase RlpA family protein [Chitinophagaceae bacterium]|jgi:rare lipoprotein A|nr:MAG: septal ring lytic transglycosylase RlpA family protein [Chitinophagaceae bacterium]